MFGQNEKIATVTYKQPHCFSYDTDMKTQNYDLAKQVIGKPLQNTNFNAQLVWKLDHPSTSYHAYTQN